LNQHLKTTEDYSYPLPTLPRPHLLLPPDHLQAPPYIPLLRFVKLPYVKAQLAKMPSQQTYRMTLFKVPSEVDQDKLLSLYEAMPLKATKVHPPTFLPSLPTGSASTDNTDFPPQGWQPLYRLSEGWEDVWRPAGARIHHCNHDNFRLAGGFYLLRHAMRGTQRVEGVRGNGTSGNFDGLLSSSV
jgi:hypothetical protein